MKSSIPLHRRKTSLQSARRAWTSLDTAPGPRPVPGCSGSGCGRAIGITAISGAATRCEPGRLAVRESLQHLGNTPSRCARRVFAVMFCCLLLLLLQLPAAGQSSATSISFQGVLNGANGQALPNGSYDLTFRFYSNAVGGVTFGTAPVAGVAVTGGVAFTAIPAMNASASR